MKKQLAIIFFFVLFSSCTETKKTETEQRILQNTLVLKDWSNLDDLVKNKQLIILGEAGHGDGATFEQKGELADYLHTKHGFNTLGFEAVSFGNDYLLASLDAEGYVKPMSSCYSPMFSTVKEMNQLMGLVDSKAMKLMGFDVYPFSVIWYIERSRDMKGVSDCIPCLDKIREIVLRYEKDDLVFSDTAIYSQNIQSILACLKKLSENENVTKEQKYTCEHLIQFLLSLETALKFQLLMRGDFDTQNIALQLRDRQMAENILWYLKHHPEEKIIINCANFHGARALSPLVNPKYPPSFYKNYLPVGYYLSEYLQDKMLTIAFTSYGGYCHEWRESDTASKIPYYDNTIETLLHDAYPRKDRLLLNMIPLRDSTLTMHSSALGYTNISGDWPQCFDAMIYLKTQAPPTRKK